MTYKTSGFSHFFQTLNAEVLEGLLTFAVLDLEVLPSSPLFLPVKKWDKLGGLNLSLAGPSGRSN
jgi:hypothetical protein